MENPSKPRRKTPKDAETEAREKLQSTALDLFRPTGASMIPEYSQRRQLFVAVNRNDLEDLLSFDTLAGLFVGTGMFCLSGAAWLLVDKALSQPFQMTALISFCLASLFFGFVFLIAGFYMHFRKRGRIQSILDETKPSTTTQQQTY